MNCTCNGPIVLVMGVERCSICGKCAGASAFVPISQPLPPQRRKRVAC